MGRDDSHAGNSLPKAAGGGEPTRLRPREGPLRDVRFFRPAWIAIAAAPWSVALTGSGEPW